VSSRINPRPTRIEPGSGKSKPAGSLPPFYIFILYFFEKIFSEGTRLISKMGTVCDRFYFSVLNSFF
jgi:hypothetical protein